MRRYSYIIDLIPVILGVLAALLLSGCGNGPESDAFGNFRATEVTVSAQAQGRLVRFGVKEGDRLEEGELVGLVDTVQLGIQRGTLQAQRQSLIAQRQATLAQVPEITAQVEAFRAQLATAQEEFDRTQRLYENQAATARELNLRRGEVAVLLRQVEQAQARAGAVREQAASIAAQVKSIESQIRETEQRIKDARITNPVSGTVLTVLARQGETVQMGSPLYMIASLDTLELRAYAAGSQLPHLRLGMPVEVLVDDGDGGLRSLHGRVRWIASEAQFTPTPIQTRDERAELVYAFDVSVPNPDGLLKIGMPAEVRFTGDQTAGDGTGSGSVPGQ